MSNREGKRAAGRNEPLRLYVDFPQPLHSYMLEFSRSPRPQKRVVFVCFQISARMAKLGKPLKAAGWDVVVFHHEPIYQDVSSWCSQAHQYNNMHQLLTCAAFFDALVYHVFASWRFYHLTQFITKFPGPTIFDDYDVMNGALQDGCDAADAVALERERLCFENASGICARSLTVQIPKKHLGVRMSAKKILFPEYCLADRPERRPKRTDGVHIVYVGTVPHQYIYDRHGLASCDLDFIRSVTSRGVHYHLYPSSDVDFETRFAPYLEHAVENPYFHFHRPLPHAELLREISQYHYGILTVSEECTRTGDWTFNPLTHRYFIPNKVFDYLDAGLQPIIFGGKTMNWYIGRTGAAIIAHREEFLTETIFRLRNLPPNAEAIAAVESARNGFAISRHIPRLERFYREVAGVRLDERLDEPDASENNSWSLLLLDENRNPLRGPQTESERNALLNQYQRELMESGAVPELS